MHNPARPPRYRDLAAHCQHCANAVRTVLALDDAAPQIHALTLLAKHHLDVWELRVYRDRLAHLARRRRR